MDRRRYKSTPQHLVSDPRTGEIKRIVNPSDTDIGTSDISANLRVFGDLTIKGGLKNADGGTFIAGGPNITVTSASNGQVTISAVTAAGASAALSYVTVAAEGGLSSERVLTGGTGVKVVDGGPNTNVTMKIDDTVVATVSGTNFTGIVKASGGLSGSIQQTATGLSYLVAGPNTTITSASNGQVTISSTGGGGGSTGGGDPGAQYLVLANTASLSAERVLTPGTGLLLTDAGANSTATLAINDGVVATLSGSTFSGNVITSGALGVATTKFSLITTAASLQTSSTYSSVPVTGSVLYSATLGDFEGLDFDAVVMANNMRGFRRANVQMTAMRANGSASFLFSPMQRPVSTVSAIYGALNEPLLWQENLRYDVPNSRILLEVTGTGIVDWSADIRLRRNTTYFTSLSSSVGEAPVTYANYLLAWYRSTDIVTNGSSVTQMVDKSGNGRHIGQGGNVTLAPTLETSVAAMNGLSTVNFNGSNQFLTGTMWNLAGAGVGYTIMAAYVPQAFDGTDALWDLSSVAGTTNTYTEHAYGGFGIRFGASSVMTYPDPTTNVGTYDTVNIATGSWEHSEIWFKGVSKATTSAAQSTRPSFIRVGSLFQDVWFFQMKLAELLIFSGTMPTGARQDVEAYLASRYGL